MTARLAPLALVAGVLLAGPPAAAEDAPAPFAQTQAPLPAADPGSISDLIDNLGSGGAEAPVAAAPPVLEGQDGVEFGAAPEPGVEPFQRPPENDSPLTVLPDNATIDYAYGAFQRGLYLSAFAIALEHARKGEPAAQTLVAYIYANGLGVPQNHKEAVTWYDLAAKGGDPSAMEELANLLMVGEGVQKDPDRARSLLEQAVAKGRRSAAYALGLIHLGDGSDGDLIKASEAFKVAADAGNSDAQYALATMYLDGQGMPRDLVMAGRMMGQAAKAGHVGAQVEYAIMLFNGKGVRKDEAAAFAWFRLAAISGNPVAENRLARLYAAGIGTKPDLKEAAKWHFRARRAGISDLWLDGVVKGLTPEDVAAAGAAASETAAP